MRGLRLGLAIGSIRRNAVGQTSILDRRQHSCDCIAFYPRRVAKVSL